MNSDKLNARISVANGIYFTIIIADIYIIAAIKFGESDVFVREGQPPRSIAIQRRDVSHPLEIRVYSTTIKEYKQHYGQIGCNLTLDEIGIQETQVDPAEGV